MGFLLDDVDGPGKNFGLEDSFIFEEEAGTWPVESTF